MFLDQTYVVWTMLSSMKGTLQKSDHSFNKSQLSISEISGLLDLTGNEDVSFLFQNCESRA